MYTAFIAKITDLEKHSNADRLQCGKCFGNTVIVDMTVKPEQVGVYFPVDGQLGVDFATKNNLIRCKDEDGNNCGGYLDPIKRNIVALKLRGEKSDGLFLPIETLSEFTDISLLKEGDAISSINGHTICEKYIPKSPPQSKTGRSGKVKARISAPIAPLFREHSDTAQLAYNMNSFHIGDHIEITLKMHGTSQRTGYLPRFQGYKRTLLDKILRRKGKPMYDWGYVSGTRRCILDGEANGYYGNDTFREKHCDFFKGKLHKGESVYYEVVGFVDSGLPIMSSCANKKLNDKEFSNTYGDTTVFSYGCHPDGKRSDFYVYRMNMTNEDGDVVEYSPEYMRYRCGQMAAKTVPVFYQGFVPSGEDTKEFVRKRAEQFYDGPDPIGTTHVREGVVVRIVNRPGFEAYKHKNFSFKVLEGIIKDVAQAPDMEEAQEEL